MAEPVKKKPATPTPATLEVDVRSGEQKKASEGQGTHEAVAKATEREKTLQATGAARLQESEANKGAYGGLGLSERSRAERMVRNGEAKDRDEAAAKIKAEKEPKRPPAAVQAKALAKP
jgi:hypothetical protein